MSHIQKILERAEREGAIRPSPVLGSSLSETTLPASAVAADEPVFQLPSMELEPSTAVVGTPTQVTSSRVQSAVMQALVPGSPVNEQYRSLRTRLQQAARGRNINALVVTSPARGEGRTHTAASLALSMAQESERRVCVVDASLRTPQLREVFGLPAGPGLRDVLTERARLEDALIHIAEHNITVLPGGDASPDSELLGTIAMRRIMQALRAQFDRIVIDAAPAIPVTDVSLLTPLVDGLVLVVRAGVTPKHAIHDAISGINSDKLLGVVLNDAR